MRARRAYPLLLLLVTPSIVASAVARDAAPRDAALDQVSNVAQNVRRDAAPAPPAAPAAPAAPGRNTPPSKPYKGTEDAPVDGFDGKPHLGPFVDTSPDQAKTNKDGTPATTSTSKSQPTSLKKFADKGYDGWRVEDIPEKNDGVMNDANRVTPKKGTTGTEGGISEKEKERRIKQSPGNKPLVPAEAPPLSHSEEQHINAEQDRISETNEPKPAAKDDGRYTYAARRKPVEPGSNGIEKPADLPDKPHNIPHPDPKSGNGPVGGNTGNRGDSYYPEGKSSMDSPQSDSPGRPSADDLSDHDQDSWHEWFHSFVLSYTMILVSEIGDKTFLVAALMAMRHSQLLVFSAALSALVVMTVLSAVLGHAVPTLLPQRLTTAAAALLFLVFGVRMLREGLAMAHDLGVGEEMREVEAELEEKEQSMALDRSRRRTSSISAHALEAGRGRTGSRTETKTTFLAGELSPPPSPSLSPHRGPDSTPKSPMAGFLNLCSLILSPAWVQTFVMTFLGEWGDRSQIATIAMAAGQDYWWVTLGAVTGHACCTGVAVIGGRALAGRVSLRVVTIGGAIAFLVFGVIYLYESYMESY